MITPSNITSGDIKSNYAWLDPDLPDFLKKLRLEGRLVIDTKMIMRADDSRLRIKIMKYMSRFWFIHEEDGDVIECFMLQ